MAQCKALQRGKLCTNPAKPGLEYCSLHAYQYLGIDIPAFIPNLQDDTMDIKPLSHNIVRRKLQNIQSVQFSESGHQIPKAIDNSLIRKTTEELPYYHANKMSHIIKRIGKGAFGDVLLLDHKKLGLCAMKIVPNNKATLDEISILKYLKDKKCPWNMKFYGYSIDGDKIQMYLEYFNGFELTELITHISVKEDMVKWVSIANEVISAVQCLHSIGVVHRDIKPGNILFNGDGIKLIDFGFSCILGECQLGNVRGTIRYLAPEGYRPQTKNLMAIDVWAVGVTLFYMFYRNTPFIDSDSTMIRLIVPTLMSNREIERFLPIAEAGSVAYKVRNIILQLLDIDPVVRVQNFRNIKSSLEELTDQILGEE